MAVTATHFVSSTIHAKCKDDLHNNELMKLMNDWLSKRVNEIRATATQTFPSLDYVDVCSVRRRLQEGSSMSQNSPTPALSDDKQTLVVIKYTFARQSNENHFLVSG